MTDGTRKFSPIRMTAATEDAAVGQALDIVGATRDEVDVDVLEEGPKGVTVRVSPRNAASQSATTASQPTPAAPVEATPPVIAPTAVPDDMAVAAPDASLNDEEGAVDEVDEEPIAPPRVPRAPIDPVLQEKARHLAEEFLERMGLEGQVSIAAPPATDAEDEHEGDTARLYLQIDGDDVGILIGKHGQTLQSFQYLINLTLNNHPTAPEGEAVDHEAALRVVVDAGGYRSRRAIALEQSAREGAARAKRDRRSVRLEPMPAHERRLVHLALRDDTTVTTGSEGREPLRHVVITPAGAVRTGGGDRGGYGQRNRSGYGSGQGQGDSRGGGYGGGRRSGPGGPGGSSGGGRGDSGGYGQRRGGGGGR